MEYGSFYWGTDRNNFNLKRDGVYEAGLNIS